MPFSLGSSSGIPSRSRLSTGEDDVFALVDIWSHEKCMILKSLNWIGIFKKPKCESQFDIHSMLALTMWFSRFHADWEKYPIYPTLLWCVFIFSHSPFNSLSNIPWYRLNETVARKFPIDSRTFASQRVDLRESVGCHGASTWQVFRIYGMPWHET